MWFSYSNLFSMGLVLIVLSVIPNYFIWLIGLSVSKLNKTSQLFIWSVIRMCVILVTICFPVSLFHLYCSSASYKQNLPENSQEGNVTHWNDAVIDNEFFVFRVISALRDIIFGTIPWMVCFSTLNFNRKRLNYKIVLLQILIPFFISLFLSIAAVSAKKGEKFELVIGVFYFVLCTALPLALIICNFFFCWKEQSNARSERNPVYSATCITLLWVVVMATFIPSDFANVLHMLCERGLIRTVDLGNRQDLMSFLLSQNVVNLSILTKFVFVALFPIVLLTSRDYRVILFMEFQRRRTKFFNRLLVVLLKEGKKRNYRVSNVSSTRGPQSFSVVINEHHQCMDECGPNEQVKCVKENGSKFCPFKPSEFNISQGFDLSSMRIDLHQLHMYFDERCDKCVKEKLRHCSLNKIAKSKNRIFNDAKNSIKKQKKKDASECEHTKENETYSIIGEAETAVKTLDRRITTISIGFTTDNDSVDYNRSDIPTVPAD